jgi:hypothetical protein
MVRKTVSITTRQAEWVEQRTINLSRFVQQALDRAISERARKEGR